MNLRVARHTSNLDRIKAFYTSIIGLEVLGGFENHDNYNGVFIGKKELDWHLEFTTSTETPDHKPDSDDLLVFYPKTTAEFNAIRERIKKQNIVLLKPMNPYWSMNGIMIQDPDGFNVVISRPNK